MADVIQASVFIAMTLDGFIAREDGAIDWLTDVSNSMEHDGGYEAFIQGVDAIVMGRSSYEKVLSFGQWPYPKKVVVLSRNEVEIPEDLRKQGVSSSSESPEELCATLARNGHKRLYIDGGVTIQRFLSAGKIDDLTVTIVPMLLGRGKPLFGHIDKDVMLHHVKTTVCNRGFVQLTYRVVR